ncbi:hypothetical protein PCC7424_1359 [Gloeothece citriformis PCC 7424]|uniref:Uncharacterized protein n=1 Tax=Gloeothece citriformis (strain PCC 7424) TaxID=65393 RepID=B7K7N5_GLOC7|nr:hypothetical protein [Gloeothece citriformis]ACK69803.1 hypothetical protein PCC7424_1359 [Gloeothece citriformis PCC 7424]
MRPIKKRPNNIGLLLIGGVIGLPTGLIISSFFPEGSAMKVFTGLGGIAAPPVALLIYSSKRWSEYIQYMLEQYEATKEHLRQNPNSVQAREAMLKAGRAYYSCMREEGVPTIYDEQAINNDMKAILGT